MFWWASKPAEGIQWSDYTLTDLATHRFHYSREPLIVGQPKYIPDRFDLRGEQASATGGGGRDTIHFTVDGYQVNLRLRSIKTAVIELGDGFFTAYCNSSYFYSRDRMPTTGTITHDGKTERVSGTSDFDRQWGFNPALTVANTTGLFFRLPDGRDILLGLVRLRAYGNEVTFYLGSIQDASGHVTTLHRGDFTMTPTAYWRRDATCSYPVDWDVHVAGLHLHLRPTVEPEEVRAIRWPELFALWPEWPTYWDGEAAFTGDATGLGWEDLNKYCLV
jgi:predicted secreted hydrolase